MVAKQRSVKQTLIRDIVEKFGLKTKIITIGKTIPVVYGLDNLNSKKWINLYRENPKLIIIEKIMDVNRTLHANKKLLQC